MKILFRLLVCSFLLCLPCGCQRADEREAHRNQTILDEADLLLQARRYREAKEEAMTALDSLGKLVVKHPQDLDMRFLLIRAQLTAFVAENAVLIQQADPRPRSLVRLPDIKEYKEYDRFVVPALEALTELLREDRDYDFEQRAFIHGNLAAIFRLSEKSTEQARQAYQETLKAYQDWLADLKAPKSKIGSKKFAIARVKRQIRETLMAEAEVDILAERWDQANQALKQAIAGDDLEHFAAQFGILEKRIVELEEKLAQENSWDDKTREKRLMMIVKNRTSKKQGMREQLAGYSNTEAELLMTREELNLVKNNLIYRVLCLHHLGKSRELAEARRILRSYYPENDAEIQSYLKTGKQAR